MDVASVIFFLFFFLGCGQDCYVACKEKYLTANSRKVDLKILVKRQEPG